MINKNMFWGDVTVVSARMYSLLILRAGGQLDVACCVESRQ